MPSYQIRISNTGETYACQDTRTVLEGMEALSRSGIPAGCRGGGCGVCKVRIEAGTVRTEKMSRCHVSVQEEAEGCVLACRAYPLSDLQVRAVEKMARCVERAAAQKGTDPLRSAHRPAP